MEKKDKNLNVPNLRFPEFSGEWEKCALGGIGTTFNGLTGKSANDFGSGSPFITYKSIFDSSKIDISKVEYVRISETERAKQTQNEVEYGDIFFTTSSETPEEVGMASVLLTPIHDCYLNSFCFGYRLFDKQAYLPDFFRFYLRSNNVRRKIAILAQGSTRFNISKNEVMKMSIFLPSQNEQRKISEFFSLIEERIETQRKIIEDLKKLKDAICNMNFTSGSALKLGNVGKFVRGLTYSASDVIDDTRGTAVMRSNNISNGDPANFEELIWVNKTPNHEQILRGGDIIICMANGSSPLVGKASYYIDCGMESATVGAFCGIYRSYNPLTKWLFQSKHYKKHIQRCIQGGNGAIANIYPEDILAISFNIPSGYERVLNVLNSLEEKCLLEQKLLYRYLAVKSHLLAQLFI